MMAEIQRLREDAMARDPAQLVSLVNDQRAMILLQSVYVEGVRYQLEVSEKKKAQPAKKGRVNGDGMPKVLTSEEFVAVVQAHKLAQEVEAGAKEKRRVEKENRAAVLAEWKEQSKRRKEENDVITAQWKAAVGEWEAEKKLAQAERRKPRWKKPHMIT